MPREDPKTTTSRSLRVYVSGVGRLGRDIVASLLANSTDAEVIGVEDEEAQRNGGVATLEEFLRSVSRLRPDLLLIGVPSEVELSGLEWLLTNRVVGIVDGGRMGFHVVLTGRIDHLSEISSDELIALVQDSSASGHA